MKVKCIKNYFDKELDKVVDIDHEFTVSETRAKALVDAGVCVVIAAPETKPRKKKEE